MRSYQYTYDAQTNMLTLSSAKGERFLSFPVSFILREGGREHTFLKPVGRMENDVLTVTDTSGDVRLTLTVRFHDDDIVVEAAASAARDFACDEAELLCAGKKGLYMVDCVRYFTPQPRNYFGINRAFYRNFCDCSMDGYFTPAPLNFSIGNRAGYVSFGLLDLPNSNEYKLTPRLGILAEKLCGHIVTRAGETYRAPRLLLTFPQDEWDGIRLFRDKLIAYGCMTPLDEREKARPAWWRRPFVVTYGDEMLDIQYNWYNDDDLDSDAFNEAWLYDWLHRAEKALGNTDFTVLVDAFWQDRYSAEGIASKKRFPHFRAFIDECHRRGHHVLLWTTPLFDSMANGFTPLSKRCGVLSSQPVSKEVSYANLIDFTSDNAPAYFEALAAEFFGSGEGQLDCDGLKLDFLARFQDPASASYQNPLNGIGIREMYRFYELFGEAARKVKPDVLLNGSACDPRFERVVSMNRLHDIQYVTEEREMRARISALACPDMPIDSDGAIMVSDWVEETYIKAVVYATPSLYYIRQFHDAVRFSEEKMRALGALLALAAKKPTGRPSYEDGNWLWSDNGRVYAATVGGSQAVVVYDGQGSGYAFSWRDGVYDIPLFGRKTAPDAEADSAALTLTGGNVLRFDVTD